VEKMCEHFATSKPHLQQVCVSPIQYLLPRFPGSHLEAFGNRAWRNLSEYPAGKGIMGKEEGKYEETLQFWEWAGSDAVHAHM